MADAPPVDLRLDGDMVLRQVANGKEAAKAVTSGSRTVEIARGSGEALIDSTSTDLAEGTSVILYVVGSEDQGNLDLMVQAISDLHSDPTSVNSGDGGLAASSGGWPPWAVAFMVLIVTGAFWSARTVVRSPPR
jgi:uncharacterized protein DUF4397